MNKNDDIKFVFFFYIFTLTVLMHIFKKIVYLRDIEMK